eukprot:GHVS01062416.1.p1 GENE.GHVS01062416.1~~GHVS01062416.1.p1  ORF type:complete len:301 (+),score=33.64 GHVS01062416.1:118-1020(+)
MKTFRITILAIGVAIAIGTTWVEARDLKVWCHENKQCAYGGQCVHSADMQNVVAELTGQSERKRSVVISEELAGVCAEVFDLWVSDSSMQKFEQYSNEHNDDERKRLQAELADDVPVVFCSGNNECKGDGNVCEMSFKHTGGLQQHCMKIGICSKVLTDGSISEPPSPTEDQEATNISKSEKMVRRISTELFNVIVLYDVAVWKCCAVMSDIEGSSQATCDWHECVAWMRKRPYALDSAYNLANSGWNVLHARATVIQVLRREKVQAVEAALKSTRQKETATLSNVAEELKNNAIFIRNE